MILSKRQKNALNKIIAQIEKIIASAELANAKAVKTSRKSGNSKSRRSRADAAVMKKQSRAARKKGVPVADLARQYGVSTAYIYMLK